jgi:hypothetical protein
MSERIEKPDTSYLNYRGKLPAAEFGASETYINSILDGSLVNNIHATATSEGKPTKPPAVPQALIPSVRPDGVGGQLNVLSNDRSAQADTRTSTPTNSQQPTLPSSVQPEFGRVGPTAVAERLESMAESGAARQWSDQELGVATDHGILTKAFLGVKDGISGLFGKNANASTAQ